MSFNRLSNRRKLASASPSEFCGPLAPAGHSLRIPWRLSRLRTTLAIGDMTALALADLLVKLRYLLLYGSAGAHPFDGVLLFGGTLPGWLLLAKAYRLYERDEDRVEHGVVADLAGLFHVVTVGTWLLFAIGWLSGLIEPAPIDLVLFWVLALMLMVLARSLVRIVLCNRPGYVQKLIIVGAGSVAETVARRLLDSPRSRIKLVGFVGSSEPSLPHDLCHIPVLGPATALPALVRALGVKRVAIAFSRDSHIETVSLMRSLQDYNVHVDIVPRLFDVMGPRSTLHAVAGLPLVGVPAVRLERSSLALKRCVDLVLASLLLLLLAPVFVALYVLVRLDSPGPALYRHERIGYLGRPLTLLKFRTMHLEHCRGPRYGGEGAEVAFKHLLDLHGDEFRAKHKLPEDPRVTRLGRFLRRTSLDELPQLVNVLRGEMSLVGPRPMVEEERIRYGDQIDVVLSLRPGLTGYWQISGRSRLSYAERVRLDLAYIGNWSLALDIEILAKTVKLLAGSRGAF